MQKPLHTYIDHTLLKSDATWTDIEKLCREAIQYQFASVCVNPTWAELSKKLIKGSNCKLCCVVGFPLGANTSLIKAKEAEELFKLGAEEIDMVMNLGLLKSKAYDQVKEDIQSVIKAAPKAMIKVIIETCLLTDLEKKIAAKLCMEAGAQFVKTSTGFSKAGATIDDVMLLRNTVGADFGVKASGGIRDEKTAISMIKAGANRIGTSHGVDIVSNHHSLQESY